MMQADLTRLRAKRDRSDPGGTMLQRRRGLGCAFDSRGCIDRELCSPV